MKQYYLVFDVESVSLHGKGFAVAAIVANKETGEIIDTFELLCNEGKMEAMDNEWVKRNVLPHLRDIPVCKSYKELRTAFYSFYMKYRDTCDVWSDVNFPVETNFLSAIVADDIAGRQWNMPYPLYDISTVVDVSVDRNAECGKKDLVKHNPLHDCIASLRCLLKFVMNNLK